MSWQHTTWKRLPEHGSATVTGSTIDYTPVADYHGSDSLSYTVNSNTGAPLSASVSITVTDINDPPIANIDSLDLIEDTPSTVDVAANDTDIDGDIATVSITVEPANGSTTAIGTTITYTPDLDYVGSDELTYQAGDDDGALSNSTTVAIVVSPITETTLSVTNLPIPVTNYASENHPEYPLLVLSSAPQTLTIPPNAVSFILSLRGEGVGAAEEKETDSLFIAGLQSPAGDIEIFRGPIGFCDTGLCSALIPRRPDIRATRGEWSYKLGTLNGTLAEIDTSNMSLDVAIRTGPAPDAEGIPTITVQPFLTATAITENELNAVLERFVSIAAASDISAELLPVIITDPRFAEVSSDFNDPITRELVSMGPSNTVNIFFLDSFTGVSGASTVGITGGIPGTQGISSGFNGVLINALSTHGITDDYFIRNTAQISFHEMGHHLGLYHTTEWDFSNNDVIDDTPDCDEDAHDTNHNGTANLSECPDASNPMFWQVKLSQTSSVLSADQRAVLAASPIAYP